MNVVVIGGGAVGCAVAYVLSRRGCRVTLVDKALPGRASAASAGGLWPVGESIGLGCGVIFHASQPGHAEVEPNGSGPQPMPRVFMDFLVESNAYFPALTVDLEKRTGIHIESEVGTGLLYVIYDEREKRYSDYLLRWLAEGDTPVEEWTAARVCEREPALTRDQLGGIYFPGDNQVNPMLLFEACKRAACSLGARFVADTEVTGIETSAGLICGVETSRGHFACDALVNAAGAWSAKIARFANLDLPIHPIRGQILCTDTLKKTLSCNVSTSQCYLLQKAHGEIIIGSSTENACFDTSVPIESLQKLAAGAQRAMPGLRDVGVKRSWSGLRPGTPDEFPILGSVPEIDNYFNATGGFRTGIVATPLSAEIVAAQVLGEPPPFSVEPFLASRFESNSPGDG